VQVPCSEGVAYHTGPESCVDDPRGRGEALTGGRVGWVLSRERWLVQGADAVVSAEGKTGGRAMRALGRPCVVEDPSMRVRSEHGNREISSTALAGRSQGRLGKAGGRSQG
jgi:hypothetical protein